MDSNVSHYSSGLQFVEKLLHENNVKGAIDFAKRVQTSSRKLKSLLQFLANIVVQVSSEDEETDWYTVLGVDPSADIKTMKIHYVQQAKKIRVIGSCEAHKLLDKAWKTLSDKVTRQEYDLRRGSRELRQNPLDVRQASPANENISDALENINNTGVSNQNNNGSIGGSGQNLEQNPLAVRQASPANENVSDALANVNDAVVSNQNNNGSIGGTDQRDDFADQREIRAMDWERIWSPQANNAPHEPLDSFLSACPSCHYESYRVCLITKADCLQCGKAFATIEGPSPDAKHKEGMSFVQDTGDSIENMPENQMPAGGDSRAEKVGLTLSDQLQEGNVAAMDHKEGNVVATEGPEKDGLKSMEVPDSDFHDSDRDRTQESLAENQLNAFYAEIKDDFEYLLDPPERSQ